MSRPWVTQRATHARWCRHPSFINYVAAMNQQLTLPHFDMTVSIEAYFGLTAWDSGQPPMIGWWKCRLVARPQVENRRWWNGEYWSAPVYEGDDDVETLENQGTRSLCDLHIQWCGLKERHPDRYPYRLFMKGPSNEHQVNRSVRRRWPAEPETAGRIDARPVHQPAG